MDQNDKAAQVEGFNCLTRIPNQMPFGMNAKAKPHRSARVSDRPKKVALGTVFFLFALAVLSCPYRAKASWWGSSVASLNVRGVTLGMSMDAVSKLHPELQETTLDPWEVVGGQTINFDPSTLEHRLSNGDPCGNDCFFIDFASQKNGGGVEDLSVMQQLPGSTDIADLFAQIEKKYGSPTDIQQGNNVADNSGSIIATWGMTINASSPEANPQSGQVLRVEVDNDGAGEMRVDFFLTDFTVEAADEQAKQAFLAQVAAQQANQANKSLNY